MASADSQVVEVSGRTIEISHPNKVFFPGLGATKSDLVGYYLAVSEPMLHATGGRAAMMQRFPDGALGKSFFQKRVPAGAPEWLQTIEVSTPNGTTSRALVIADMAHVIWAVNLGCLGFHIWPFHTGDPGHADELRIDLDPQAGVSFAEVREAAACVRELLGDRGLHVYARLEARWDSFQVRAGAVALARELERRRPDLVTANWWKEERGRRVFVDFNQNAPHKTVFGAWSARARTDAQVSAPLSWDEVASVDPDGLTIATVPERVRRLGDPWAQMADQPQSLEPLLALSTRDAAAGLRDAPWPPQYPKQPDEPSRVAPSRARKD
jgi:DNA ligase D-like protein (predicted polymerase)